MHQPVVFCSVCTMSSYKESLCSLSHLLMSFLLKYCLQLCDRTHLKIWNIARWRSWWLLFAIASAAGDRRVHCRVEERWHQNCIQRRRGFPRWTGDERRILYCTWKLAVVGVCVLTLFDILFANMVSWLCTLGTHYHPTLDPAVLWTPSNDTSRPICSDSLNPMPPAILYLRTLWRYTNAVIIIIIFIIKLLLNYAAVPSPYC